MAGTDASEGQAVWQPGGAEEDSRLREGDRHLHLAYDDEEKKEVLVTLAIISGHVGQIVATSTSLLWRTTARKSCSYG